MSSDELTKLNEQFYNIYYLPNYPKHYEQGTTVSGSQIDTFDWVFVDMDLKHGDYTKEQFIEKLVAEEFIPTKVVDSGNGIHAYWRVTDLDAMSFLRLQRRLLRYFNTDDAVAKVYQLLRVPGYLNVKNKDAFKPCTLVYEEELVYTCEQLNSYLPQITLADEEYCQQHYAMTYAEPMDESKVTMELPLKFAKLIRSSKEAKELYAGDVDDRSKADYRLAHIMYAEGFTKEEAMSVLVNCRKALDRAPQHRYNYALNIVDKIWVFEETQGSLSNSVRDILRRGETVKGTRFPCWEVYDGTHHGFHLTEVLGLIGGAGSGKTTLALNYFYWFTKLNPDYIHLFVSLEQPENEIANRWVKVAGDNDRLHDRVHVLSNYNEDGSYRNLSLHEIEAYVIELQAKLKVKVGCVVIDHIGVLKKEGKDGEAQGLIDICHNMKAFAKRTNTFLVMQSQTSREKAGIGDLELDKDAAYGTSMFEWYCDYIVTTWQPLKRVYSMAPEMTCSAFKYCKIRHKNVKLDRSKEDVVHALMFDVETEQLKEMTEAEETAYAHYNAMATTIRNKDRKREPTRITKIDWVGKKDESKVNSS